MITAFTPEEISLICNLLDSINEDHSLSFLYSYIGHKNYAYWYDETCDKLESYSPLTVFKIQEIDVILDALRLMNNFPDDEASSDILSCANSAYRKTRRIRAALSPDSK